MRFLRFGPDLLLEEVPCITLRKSSVIPVVSKLCGGRDGFALFPISTQASASLLSLCPFHFCENPCCQLQFPFVSVSSWNSHAYFCTWFPFYFFLLLQEFLHIPWIRNIYGHDCIQRRWRSSCAAFGPRLRDLWRFCWAQLMGNRGREMWK